MILQQSTPTHSSPSPFPSIILVSLHCLFLWCPAKPQFMLSALKSCFLMHLSTTPLLLILSAVKLLLCPFVDQFHFGDSPPQLPWEPTTSLLLLPSIPQTPGRPRKTLTPSICPCPSLIHSLPFPPASFPSWSSASSRSACSHSLSHVNISHCR